MSKGLFITFEGIEGSGKTTQFKMLADELIASGYGPIVLREPGGTPIGDRIRDLLLDPVFREMTAETEALLYAASRAQLVNQVIEPALSAGGLVICDRYLDSSIAYQVYGRGLADTFVKAINKRAVEIKPDITILLDIDTKVGLARATSTGADRIEGEAIDFHERVRQGYLLLAREEPERIVVLDGARPMDELARAVLEVIEKVYNQNS